MLMFHPEVANMLAQCTTPVVLVVDHAKSPKHSATASAAPLPALSPFKRTMKAKRATRRGRQLQGELPTPPSSPSLMKSKLRTELLVPACRWTAETPLHCLPSKHHPHELVTTNQAPRKPGQFRFSAEPSSDRCDSLKSLLIQSSPSLSSPRMPRRKASFRIHKSDPQSLPPSPLCSGGGADEASSSPPRQPQRRYRVETADLLQEALDSLRLCDLSSSRCEPEQESNYEDDAADDPTNSTHHSKSLIVEKQRHRPSVISIVSGQ